MTYEEMLARLAELEAERGQINIDAEARFADPDNTVEVRGAYVLDAEGNPTATPDPNVGYTDEEIERMAAITTEETTLNARAARAKAVAERSQQGGGQPGMPQFQPAGRLNPHDFERARTASPDELRSQAETAVEQLRGISPEAQENLADRLGELDHPVAYRHAIVTSSDEFRSAFVAQFFGDQLDGEQRQAVDAAQEMRAALGLDAAGLMTPVTLDPTFIHTADSEIDPFRMLSDVITVTSTRHEYNTMGAMVASMDLEHEEVSEDSPGVSGGEIPLRKGQLFGSASYELRQDMPQFEASMRREMARAKATLEAAQFTSGDPVANAKHVEGFFTGMTTSAIADVTAAGASPVEADVRALRASIQNVHRGSAVWLGNIDTRDAVAQLESTGGFRIYHESLAMAEPDTLLSAAFYEASMMDSPGTGNRMLALANLRSAYRILDRVGMTVLPMGILQGANNRPTGEYGLYGYWRFGAKVVNPNAARILVGA